MRPREARLTPGVEYLALLWPDGEADEQLMLPILSGHVTAAGELNGLTAAQALAVLERWSRERREYFTAFISSSSPSTTVVAPPAAPLTPR